MEPGLLHRRSDPWSVRVTGGGQRYWIEEHAIAGAIIWPAVITAVFLPLAVGRYQNLSR